MEVTRLKAERRNAMGRNQVKTIRSQGWLPAVIYGGGAEPLSISISDWEMEQHIRHHHRVFQIEVEGKRQDAYLQDIQWEAMTERLRHVDFKRIDLTVEIETKVTIEYLGHPVGLAKGGALVKDLVDLPVKCLPLAIPEKIEVKVAHLDMDDVLRAKDLAMPKGVTLLLKPEQAICHVAEMVMHAPAETVAAVAEPEVAGAPKAEGAEAAPAAGAKEAAPAKDAAKEAPKKDAPKK
jgi:large subunit ribosomal protein L25